jgi:hypothetical protein
VKRFDKVVRSTSVSANPSVVGTNVSTPANNYPTIRALVTSAKATRRLRTCESASI